MENERHMQFLMGLNQTYVAVRVSILMMSLLTDTRKAFSMTLQCEWQLDVTSCYEETNCKFQVIAVNQSGKTFKGSSTLGTSFSRTGGASRKTFKCKLNGFPVDYKLHGKNIRSKNRRIAANIPP